MFYWVENGFLCVMIYLTIWECDKPSSIGGKFSEVAWRLVQVVEGEVGEDVGVEASVGVEGVDATWSEAIQFTG